MALARIITRSQPCSRQLALDLIARGYAVEIVSPDSIPDNLADLELRVEEDPGNQLVASVEAHNGDRSASLEFVHYLKAPIPDFIRRPPPEPHKPEPHKEVHFPEPPVSFNAEKSAEDVELVADAPQLAPEPAPETVSPAVKVLRESKLDPESKPDPDRGDGTRLILPPGTSPTPTADRANHIASASSVPAPSMPRPAKYRPTTTAPMTALPGDVRPLWKPQPSDQFPGSFRNVAVAMALMLALVFGFGTRPNNKATARGSGAAAASIAKASMVPEKTSVTGQEPTAATKPEVHPNNGPKELSVAKDDNDPIAKAPTAKAPTEVSTKTVETGVSSGHGDGLIARDTVTYLDKGAFDQAASKAKVAQSSTLPQPISRKHEGVIAENSVTVLNSNPAPKAAKPDSGIKRYSDLK